MLSDFVKADLIRLSVAKTITCLLNSAPIPCSIPLSSGLSMSRNWFIRLRTILLLLLLRIARSSPIVRVCIRDIAILKSPSIISPVSSSVSFKSYMYRSVAIRIFRADSYQNFSRSSGGIGIMLWAISRAFCTRSFESPSRSKYIGS